MRSDHTALEVAVALTVDYFAGSYITRRKICDRFGVSYRTACRYICLLKAQLPSHKEEVLDSGEFAIRRPSKRNVL
jgi:hypothetical protein